VISFFKSPKSYLTEIRIMDDFHSFLFVTYKHSLRLESQPCVSISVALSLGQIFKGLSNLVNRQGILVPPSISLSLFCVNRNYNLSSEGIKEKRNLKLNH
jgi:hypothetical protein